MLIIPEYFVTRKDTTLRDRVRLINLIATCGDPDFVVIHGGAARNTPRRADIRLY